MDIQSLFYTVGILYMALWIVFFVLGITVLLQVMSLIKNAPRKIEERISQILEEKKGSLLGMAAMAIVPFFISKLKNRFMK